ncbi:hypothetical protein [Streptomyces longisporoflavus]|uniref:Gram-positive cocci surface proteins LPxTG domain-containing protein n=1 Tax=Streptomyces longisporoflavus TaxID=28044 RepID=A0ABW7QZ33_9ACTN
MAMATACLTAGMLGAAAIPPAAADARHDAALIAGSGTVAPDHNRPDKRETEPGQLAKAGSDSDTMLYAGLAISLCVLGALAVAAARSRRD